MEQPGKQTVIEQEIAITVDTNDGDYTTKTSIISKEVMDIISPLIESIKNVPPCIKTEISPGVFMTDTQNNFPFMDYDREEVQKLHPFSDDVFDEFETLLPDTINGFHSIDSIFIYPVPTKIQLL